MNRVRSHHDDQSGTLPNAHLGATHAAPFGNRGTRPSPRVEAKAAGTGSSRTRCWRELVWTPSAGQERFWLGTVMSVAGLCPACSRGNAAGLDGLSASRGSHLDFALDAHPLAAGLPR